MYRYSLDKSSKKFLCPGCGKKTFVRFKDNETGYYCDDEAYGRCDRETSCQYILSPKEDKTLYNYTPPVIVRREPTYHSHSLVTATGRGFAANNLIQFLKSVFGSEAVKEAVLKYLIGTSKEFGGGAMVYWQVDNKANVRAGKVMQYHLSTGKRVKDAEGRGRLNWVHKLLKLKDFELSQCLFGLHLVNETSTDSIALVESEKSALILSMCYPMYTWLATGGKQNFKEDMLNPIKQYKIVAFPDKGELMDWQHKARALEAKDFRITVSTALEYKEQYPEGTDLADIEVMKRQNDPDFIYRQKGYTDTEIAVHRIKSKQASLQLLIDTFDLTDQKGNDIRSIVI